MCTTNDVAVEPSPCSVDTPDSTRLKSPYIAGHRFCMRFVPVEHTCYASKEEISKAADDLVAKHFASGEGVTPLKVPVVRYPLQSQS